MYNNISERCYEARYCNHNGCLFKSLAKLLDTASSPRHALRREML